LGITVHIFAKKQHVQTHAAFSSFCLLFTIYFHKSYIHSGVKTNFLWYTVVNTKKQDCRKGGIAMKKYPYMICSAAVLCALMLAGCGSSHEKELEQQVAQLQKQVQDLQTDAADNPESTGSGESAPASAQEESTDTLDALTEKVQKAVQNADAATASGSLNERISVFFEHKTALDALDRELDALEDDFEAQYRSGSLRYEDFRTRDRKIEDLEESLDDAEDRLENRFALDD
jgi:outer membrane murein-binding lipoprotein Lpp